MKKVFDDNDAELLETIILQRRDVRGNNFLHDPVSDAIIDKILFAAYNAPSVGFSQPWEFVIIKDKQTKERIRNSFTEENNRASGLFQGDKSEKYKQLKLEGIQEAPVNIAVFYKPSPTPVLGQNTMKEVGLYSVICAVQNMWLMARALNVGIGWVSILDPEKVKIILNAPQENQLVAYLCVGYVKEFLEKPELEILKWEKRKVTKEIIIKEKYKKRPIKKFTITPVSKKLKKKLQHTIDFKTKPLGALGMLEEIALQIGLIQNTLSPSLDKPHIVVFAGDHGIAKDGVSAYPQEVTFQMVMNFLAGGAAINVFCKQNNIAIRVVDAGVNYAFPKNERLINAKVGMGTASFLTGPAMSREELALCFEKGAKIVKDIFDSGCNVIGFGEMGIGNTASASVLMSKICRLPIEECVGKGTGIDDKGVKKKISLLKNSIANNKISDDPYEILATFGGFEIAQICAGMLQAAEKKMLILVDGFIATAAFLVAHSIHPAILDYTIFCHQSDENGHAKMLRFLGASPVMSLHMRLGEGTGAAVSYPIIQSAVNFLNEMASFESAGVSNKE
jgi:nicotinate-nucleotide--dimethylbenzimidazole phosphoribosyltransferase